MLGCQASPRNSHILVTGGIEVAGDELLAVIAVMQASGEPCSGTIVGAGTILTAAHCALDPEVTVFGRRPTRVIRGDDSGTAGATDLAILVFEPSALGTVTPIAAAITAPVFGDRVSIVGFGRDSHSDSKPSFIKRRGENYLSSVDELLLITTPSADQQNPLRANIAGGDSGGPLLWHGMVSGVASGFTWGANGSAQGWFVNLSSDTSRAFLDKAQSQGARITWNRSADH